MWILLLAVVTFALALMLALTDHAVMALPLVVVIVGLVRAYVRKLTGKRIQPRDLPAGPR
jgi:membrane protein implicated in regulation of membrane protease activity